MEKRRSPIIGLLVVLTVVVSIAIIQFTPLKFLNINFGGGGPFVINISFGGGQTNIINGGSQNGGKSSATSIVAPTQVGVQETVKVPFSSVICGRSSNPVKTRHAFEGKVSITVSGVGHARSTDWSDALYIYTDASGKSVSPYHNNSEGGIMFIDGQPVDNFVKPDSIPAYNPTHTYTFTIHAPGGLLSFSVADCKPGNNSGSYTIIVSSTS